MLTFISTLGLLIAFIMYDIDVVMSYMDFFIFWVLVDIYMSVKEPNDD